MISNAPQVYILIILFIVGFTILASAYVAKLMQDDNIDSTRMFYFKVYFLTGFVLMAMAASLIMMNRELSPLQSNLSYMVPTFFLLLALCKEIRRKAYMISFSFLIIVTALFNYYYREYNLTVLTHSVFVLLTYLPLIYIVLREDRSQPNLGLKLYAFGFFLQLVMIPFMLYFYMNSEVTLAYDLKISGGAIGFAIVSLAFLTYILISEHSKLTHMALNDTLTGLNNRRGLYYFLDRIVSMLERDKSTLSVAVIDVDHFKKINDTYGHDGGDAVLQTLAGIFRSTSRESDICCRFGGEEFIIVLPKTDTEAAITFGEKIRQAVEKQVIQFEEHTIRLTASIGLATSSEQIDVDMLIKDADKALYAAKENGRNKVCHHKDLPCRLQEH